jgi:hypothetical protein
VGTDRRQSSPEAEHIDVVLQRPQREVARVRSYAPGQRRLRI